VPEDSRAFESDRVAKLRLVVDPSSSKPPPNSSLWLLGQGGVNVCPRVPATLRDVVSVEKIFKSIDDPDYTKVFGSLKSDTVLISYTSTASEGMSGAPVVRTSRTRAALVAIHLGGMRYVVQWGVPVGTVMLRNALAHDGERALVRLDAAHPTIVAESFAAPTKLFQFGEELRSRIDIGMTARNGLLALIETSTPLDPFGAVSNSLELGWTHRWLTMPFSWLGTSFGSRLLLGGVNGLYRSPVFDAHHQEEPLKGTAKLPFYGGFVESDAEFSLALGRPISYVVGVGVRLGISHLPDVGNGGTHVVGGPAVYGRAKWRWSDNFSGMIQLHVTLEEIPADKCPVYCKIPAIAAPTVLDVWGGLGLGVEFAL
jgi:hypothetical protein